MDNVKAVIIDDEPWARQVVRSLGDWQRLGITVVGEAEDGREGLRLIEGLRPGIVITDMRMPGIEGVALLQAIHELDPSARIVVMSGYDDFVYLQQAIKSRAVNYLLKPIDPDELNESLAACKLQLEALSKPPGRDGSAPYVHLEASVLERYAAYRKQIYGSMLESNAAAAADACIQLGGYLEQAVEGAEALAGLRSKLAYDMTMLLEEYLASVQLSLNDVLDGGLNEQGMQALVARQPSVRAAAGEAGRIVRDALAALADIHQRKARLDMAEVEAYVDSHYLDAISLETIARHFMVSKEHLSRAYKQRTGSNVTDAIVRKRMERARELIAIEGISIKHAAELTGYADIAYFYRVFKKHYGCTPGELRR